MFPGTLTLPLWLGRFILRFTRIFFRAVAAPATVSDCPDVDVTCGCRPRFLKTEERTKKPVRATHGSPWTPVLTFTSVTREGGQQFRHPFGDDTSTFGQRVRDLWIENALFCASQATSGGQR